MPFIHIKTNKKVTAEQAHCIKSHLDLAIAAIPGKTADWLMVEVEENCNLFSAIAMIRRQW